MAQMWRTGLPWNAENLQQRKVDYEHDIKGLAKDFVQQLDAAMPEEHKLPRDDDGSFNLRAKDEGKLRDGTKKYAGFNINSPKQLVEKLTVLLGGEVPLVMPIKTQCIQAGTAFLCRRSRGHPDLPGVEKV